MENYLVERKSAPVEVECLAKHYANGFVYQIDKKYRCQGGIPKQAIVGAWQVDSVGNLTGMFIRNPNYVEYKLT
jgi:hypothetical protein